jgi:hypothetical protein
MYLNVIDYCFTENEYPIDRIGNNRINKWKTNGGTCLIELERVFQEEKYN